MILTILQWRAYGADEDCLSCELMDIQEGDDKFGMDAAHRLAERQAEEQELRYEPDAEDMGEEHGDLLFIESVTFAEGEIIQTKRDGRKFRIHFEEVK
jgi:hypothetical protein